MGRTAAYLFFLNPISIIITGDHNQFDNLALLLGLLSTLFIGDDFENALSPKKTDRVIIPWFFSNDEAYTFCLPSMVSRKAKRFIEQSSRDCCAHIRFCTWLHSILE